MSTLEIYDYWLNSPHLSDFERAELLAIKDDEKEINERFFAPLAFGTAGLSGRCDRGIHRMNRSEIDHATQAFSDVLKERGQPLTASIWYDMRMTRDGHARIAASGLAANGDDG